MRFIDVMVDLNEICNLAFTKFNLKLTFQELVLLLHIHEECYDTILNCSEALNIDIDKEANCLIKLKLIEPLTERSPQYELSTKGDDLIGFIIGKLEDRHSYSVGEPINFYF